MGLVRIYAGTQPERAVESVAVIRSEVQRLERHGLTDDELVLAKTRLKSRVVLNNESTGSRAMRLGRDWFYERDYRPLSESREEIDAVTGEQIMAVLDRIRPTEHLGLAALGPVPGDDLEAPLSSGDVDG
jgi:predicted Zn-dependent peptidase